MVTIEATVDVDAPTTRTWSALVDWPAHGAWTPLTTVRVISDRPDGLGARFVGRTGVGPVAFDDPMEIVEWSPPQGEQPGRCAVRKRGRVVLGSARFEVHPLGPRRSLVVWREDVDLPPVWLTRPLGPLVSLAGRVVLRRVLRRFARHVEAGFDQADPAASAG